MMKVAKNTLSEIDAIMFMVNANEELDEAMNIL
ncbi:GTP-binding protein Era [Staphylococcus aureus]|uniref:GTP-binding protein Era n=1 Tax=Staphylococcus aureus TaxID=1280 RepID=A0A2X2LYN8_STAAU|nr:GTP-binding protein Era [Staphylococcus aureus]